MIRLRTCRAHRLVEEGPREQEWLIDGLWSRRGVGIVGGEPKCCKSFLALDMAASVAGAVPCLHRFPVPQALRVLLYAAEDDPSIVRRRLAGIAASKGLILDELDIHAITEPVLRLDQTRDREKLEATVAQLAPRLLILDPFVRLHQIDENQSGEVAPILGSLRRLQRKYDVAIVVVHHARKGGGRGRAGQELRGSSDFHAWGDCNLYVRRRKEQLLLTIEQRDSVGQVDLPMGLVEADGGLAPRMLDEAAELPPEDAERDPARRLLGALREAKKPLTAEQLRSASRMRTQTLGQVLRDLVDSGGVRRVGRCYEAAPSSRDGPTPALFPSRDP